MEPSRERRFREVLSMPRPHQHRPDARRDGTLQVPQVVADEPGRREIDVEFTGGPQEQTGPGLPARTVLVGAAGAIVNGVNASSDPADGLDHEGMDLVHGLPAHESPPDRGLIADDDDPTRATGQK